MLSIGHPVIGDNVYGNTKANTLFSEKYDLHRQALHAYRVEFTHESERVYGIAPLKQDMRCVIQRLVETFEPAEESEYFDQKEYIK